MSSVELPTAPASTASLPRHGYAARAAARPRPPAQRVEAPWAVAASSLRKLIWLWGALHRARYFDAARFARYQERRLARLLPWAFERVPLYGELWSRGGLGARDLRAPGALARLPILEKDDIRNVWPEGCVARGAELARCRIQQTSGSTGQCMEIALSLRCDDARNVYSQRIYGWHGFRWYRRAAYLFPYRLPFRNNLGLYRNVYIDATQTPGAILDAIERVRPVVLAATPSDILDLLEGAPADRDLRRLGLGTLCLHSEPASLDERAHFAGAFGCAVRANYYCNEVWAIAAECEEGTLHQFADNVVLELVDAAGRPVPDGEPGQVVVTSLNNFVQPCIRYRLGDVAVRSAGGRCRCGRGLPVLDRLEGRDDDVFRHPDGRLIHPSKITVAVKSPCFAHPGLQIYRDYRIVQDAWDHVTLRIVPGRDCEFFERCARRSAANLRALLSPGVDVRLHVVDRLEPSTGGKRKIFVGWNPGREEGDAER